MATDPTPEPRAEQTHPHQAQAVIAAAILRQLHAVVITGRRWDPAIATHGTRQLVAAATAA
jgi:transposase